MVEARTPRFADICPARRPPKSPPQAKPPHFTNMDNYTRYGYTLNLPDAALCQVVGEMERGLIDADLGGSLYKKRVARPGSGKRSGYRTLLSARIGSRYVFLHGFPKSSKANITQDEKKALQFAGKVFLNLSSDALSKALQSGVLLEVHCEHNH